MVGEERTNTILSKSLFLVVAGSDDIANSYFDSRVQKFQYDVPAYTDLMATSAASFLKVILIAMQNPGIIHALPFPTHRIPFLYSIKQIEGIAWIGSTQNSCYQCTSIGVSAITEKLSRRDTKRVC